MRVVDVGQPGDRRQEQVPQPAALRLDLEVLDHRRHDVRLAGGEQLLTLLLVDLLGRVDVRVHEVLEPLHVLLRRRRQGKVHVVLLRRSSPSRTVSSRAVTVLGRGDLSPRRRPRRRGPVVATVVVLAALAAGWLVRLAPLARAVTAAARRRRAPASHRRRADARQAPAQVTVAVLNATDKVGLAHQVAAALRAQGLRIGKVGNTKTRVGGVATSAMAPPRGPRRSRSREYVPGATLVQVDDGRGDPPARAAVHRVRRTGAGERSPRPRPRASASPRPVVCTTP